MLATGGLTAPVGGAEVEEEEPMKRLLTAGLVVTAGLCAGVSPASAGDDERNQYKALVFTKAAG